MGGLEQLLDIPLIPVVGLNHGQILSEPPQELIALVLKALSVNSKNDFDNFHANDVANAQVVQQARAKLANNRWQQFVVRATDSHGNPITDYSIEIIVVEADGTQTPVPTLRPTFTPTPPTPATAAFTCSSTIFRRSPANV
jgi:hypothetical protein